MVPGRSAISMLWNERADTFNISALIAWYGGCMLESGQEQHLESSSIHDAHIWAQAPHQLGVSARHLGASSGVPSRPPSPFVYTMPPKTPAAGWCAGSHAKRQRVAAQSGHRGFCKACFAEWFPEEYEERKQRRLHACMVCSEVKSLLKGVCKGCRSARTCTSCGDVNAKPDAPVCPRCESPRRAVGAGCDRRAICHVVSQVHHRGRAKLRHVHSVPVHEVPPL